MNTNKTVVAITQVDNAQLRDDVVERALANGFTINELASYERSVQYRKQYATRPDVIAKRKAYSARRYKKQQELRNLLKGL